jgi:hypothetical protein
MEEQLKDEEKKSREDLIFYFKEKWQPPTPSKKDALKISLAYLDVNMLQYYHICWFIAGHSTI